MTAAETLDSAKALVTGDRRLVLTQGHKDDTGKLRIELLPPEAIEAIAAVFNFGASKYEDRNWEKGIVWSRVYGAAMRHLLAWWRGEDKDPESGLSHLAHAGCCVFFLLAYEKHKTNYDDRPSWGERP